MVRGPTVAASATLGHGRARRGRARRRKIRPPVLRARRALAKNPPRRPSGGVLLPPVWTGLTGVVSSNDGRAGASGPVPSCYEPSDRPRRRGHLEIMQVPGRADSGRVGPPPKLGWCKSVRRSERCGVDISAWCLAATHHKLATCSTTRYHNLNCSPYAHLARLKQAKLPTRVRVLCVLLCSRRDSTDCTWQGWKIRIRRFHTHSLSSARARARAHAHMHAHMHARTHTRRFWQAR